MSSASRPPRSTMAWVVLSAIMIVLGVLAWRFFGAASVFLRLGAGLWCAAWIAAPLLAIANQAERRGQTYDALSAKERLWRRSTERHDAVLAQYAPFETDPFTMLEYPSISDVTQDSTAAFFEALGEAQALRTETFPDDSGLLEDYQIRVSRLERAWEIARRHALKIGRSYLDPGDAADLEQAIKLLRHAQGVTSDLERNTYVERAQRLLRDLAARGAIVLPPRVIGTIEASTRKAIASPASEYDDRDQ